MRVIDRPTTDDRRPNPSIEIWMALTVLLVCSVDFIVDKRPLYCLQYCDRREHDDDEVMTVWKTKKCVFVTKNERVFIIVYAQYTSFFMIPV